MKTLFFSLITASLFSSAVWANPVLTDSQYCSYSGSIEGLADNHVRGNLVKSGEEYHAIHHGYHFFAHPEGGHLVITSPTGETSGEVVAWETPHYSGLKTTLETSSAHLTLNCY